MSNGNCTDHCRDLNAPYAFAVIQYKDCYCSNLIPRSQVDINRCEKQCPGYGTENCGNIDDGLFIYIQNGQPSGTAPGPSSAQPTSKTVSSSAIQSSSTPPPPPPTSTQASSSSSSTLLTVSTICFVELQALCFLYLFCRCTLQPQHPFAFFPSPFSFCYDRCWFDFRGSLCWLLRKCLPVSSQSTRLPWFRLDSLSRCRSPLYRLLRLLLIILLLLYCFYLLQTAEVCMC
jgi:hypothetical protein